MDLCYVCKKPAEFSCKDCKEFQFCSHECSDVASEIHYTSELIQNEQRENELIGALPPQKPAIDHSYKKRGFYRASNKLLQTLWTQNFFQYLCIISYMTSPLINRLLWEVDGSWSKLKSKKYQGTIYEMYFSKTIAQGYGDGVLLTDPSRTIAITSEAQLLYFYPQLVPYLNRPNDGDFAALYTQQIQQAIYRIPRLKRPLITYRGYAPIDVPNSLSLDIDKYRIGQTITNWGFTSISLDSRVSAHFVVIRDPKLICCMMKITIPAGFPALMVSSDSSDKKFFSTLIKWTQQEILLPVGTKFRIDKRIGKKTYTTYISGRKVNLKTVKVTVVGIENFKK